MGASAGDAPFLRVVPTEDGIAVSGEVDLATWAMLSNGLRGAADRIGRDGHLVLDISELSFIDGHGLGVIAAMARAVGPARRIVLRGASPSLRRLAVMLSLDGEPGLVIEEPGSEHAGGAAG